MYENYSPKWAYTLQQDVDNLTPPLMPTPLGSGRERSCDESAAASVASSSQPKKKRRVYDGPKLRYTLATGGKRAYLQTGWNNDGMLRFKQLCTSFNALMSAADIWKVCIESWESYIDNVRGDDETSSCWVPEVSAKIDLGDKDAVDNDDNSKDDHVTFRFNVPDNVGSSGFHYPMAGV